MRDFCLRCNKHIWSIPLLTPLPYVHTPHTSLSGSGTLFQSLTNWTIPSRGCSEISLVVADRDICSLSPGAVRHDSWRSQGDSLLTRSWVSGPWYLVALADAVGRMSIFLPFLCCGLFYGSTCTSLRLSALHCVWLTGFTEQADTLVSCDTPGLCLSATKCVVTFPPQHAIPSCLWRGLLAPLGITTKRAAVFQPPPDWLNWVVVNLLLEGLPMQQAWLSLTFITWKPRHRWFCISYNPLSSLQSIKHMASTYFGNFQESRKSWAFQKVDKQLSVLPYCKIMSPDVGGKKLPRLCAWVCGAMWVSLYQEIIGF